MITGNDKLSNDRFLLLIIQLVLVVILFYTYFPLNSAIKEMHNNGQGIGGGWWFIIIGWVLFIEPLIFLIMGWILAIIICVLTYKLIASDISIIPIIFSLISIFMFFILTFFILVDPKLLFIVMGSYFLSGFTLFLTMKKRGEEKKSEKKGNNL
ncbi:hypothetical protein GU336_00845 [Lactococcus raffinolactis]|uniref:Uncharacterized protein n=1 Tax=Pseudolactococcus raffinolactis TaxID=1366 RepID=A0A6H0U9L4_9LACT|nr:hypothetical protein [Lactococcus raffinolactis]QIW52821.1 hypothetical protein GU336_00845 [Lactococcus raffinolactis]